MKAIRSRRENLYGLCKVHQAVTDVFLSFRHIYLATGTASCRLANSLVPKISSITFNECTVKDSFAFDIEVVYQDSTLFMGSLDVDSLITNIVLKKNINICINLHYNKVDVIEGINKS